MRKWFPRWLLLTFHLIISATIFRKEKMNKIIVECQNCGCETEIPHIEHEEYCNQCFIDMGYYTVYE